MKRQNRVYFFSLLLIYLVIAVSMLSADEGLDSWVYINQHYQKEIDTDPEKDILLDGVNSGEILEIQIEGTVYDFTHLRIDSRMSGDDLIISESPLHELGTLSNRRIVISTYLAEGIPSEKIRWRGADGRSYEFTFLEDLRDGDTYWEYSMDLMKSDHLVWIPGTHEEMLPFGWSPEGKFAFIRISEEHSGRGGTIFDFTILDAVTDETVHRETVIPFDDPDFLYGESSYYEAAAWKKALAEFEKQMNTQGIITPGRAMSFPLQEFPLKDGESEYKGRFSLKEEKNEYRVEIIRSDGSGKTCVKKIEDFSVQEGYVAGYFESPYEPRILIVYGLKHSIKDWEGPDAYIDTIYLRFTGAHLQVGF